MNNQIVSRYNTALYLSKQLEPAEAVLQQLQQYILQQLPQAPRLSDAASALHMSCRTLQRALKQANSSFRQLVSQCRHQLAQRYLMDASLSLQQIAYQLGFEEQSSFQKAFKCWQGCSPGIYRQRGKYTDSRHRYLSGLSQSALQVNYGIN
ncbi:helix-turn-helix domain-containing protein [Rheinheimera maricola]|uniref:Helix-turn-helix transcriptional regulator n=1 Tax=Rheinheimera maricola TaxID=2793282 RepID=A0ABS7XDG6_9GAMM|nr:helix-turn-helix transcriptional regulator [Rheinheimera maricola]MBZ9613371.1 helix-turn-helix transcriptional regulator [Rheinheimera maricola]